MSTKNVFKTIVFGVLAAVSAYACTDAPGGDQLGEVESEVALPPPTNLVVVNTKSTRQDLTWTAVAGTVKHIVFRGLAGPGSETTYTECCTGTTNTFVADHLTPATNYCWFIVNVNNLGQRSAPSNEVCLTTPGTPVVSPPATVTATAVSASRINVDWSAVAGATKYFVNESVAGGAFTRVGSVTAPALQLQRANLLASTEYCYTVETVTNDGTSVPSSPAACATTFSQGLEGYWRFDEKAGGVANDISGFGRNATLAGGAAFSTLQPKPNIDDDKSYLEVPAGGGAATTAAVGAFRLTGAFSVVLWANNVSGGNAILMGMHAVGSCGAGAQGWELSQNGGALQFISQTGTNSFGQGLAANTWTHVAVTYAGGAGGAMRLYINGTQVAQTAYTASNSLTTQGLAFGHAGGCAGGEVQIDEAQVYSRELSAAEVGRFGTLPPPPTNLTITRIASGAMDLAWTAPAGGATAWIIKRAEGAPASGNEVFYTHAPNPPTTYNGDHLLANTEYAWQVLTVQNGLFSVPSNEVVGTTLDVPAAPQNVTATPISNTRIRITWSAVPNAVKYFLQQSTDGVNFSPKGSILAPTTTFDAANLTPNTQYFYRIRAQDSSLNLGPFSAVVSATTLP
jgi:hypothetical protein